MKKRLFPILIAMLMVFAMMPMTAGTVFADDIEVPEIIVTLDPGSGSGDPISFTSQQDGRFYGISNNGAEVANGQFYCDWSYFYLKLPDCPESFSGQDGEVFTGWRLSDSGATYNPGRIIQATYNNMKLTATWAVAGDASLSSLTVDKGELDPPFSPDVTRYTVKVYYEGSPVEVIAEATPAQSNATVKYNGAYDSCPTLRDGNTVSIRVTNGATEKVYRITVNALYSITTEVEGNGSVKTTNFYMQDLGETNTALNGNTFKLVATPSDGWKFKEWKLISGSGTLNNPTPTTATYLINGDNAVVKAIFVPTYTVTFKAAGGTWADGTTDDKEVTVEKGQAAIAPENPTREGFSFSGWNKDFSDIKSDLTVTAQWVTEVDGVVYTLNEDGTTATVTDYDHDNPPSSVTIPEKINNCTVTGIRNKAFLDCMDLTAITIPASVSHIGEYAFYDSGLTTVEFAEGSKLENIGKSAFQHAANLLAITIPASVTSIEGYALSECTNLTTITIPASVSHIGEYAFYDSGLTTVEFAEGSKLENIGEDAFYECNNLKSIMVPAGVTSIGRGAFYGSGLQIVEFAEESKLESIEKDVFIYCGSLKSITIPSGVTSIGEGSFHFCTSLESITIPSNVTSIGNAAFYACPLTSINFLGSQDKWNAITGEGKPNIDGASNIIFTNDDGTELQFSIVKSGETPSYKGATPTKAADAQYKYAFAGWTPEITAVTGDATYTAAYDKIAKISIKDAKVALSATSYTYNAKVHKPAIKTIKGLTLKEGTDYTANWSNASSKNAGTYSVTITGQGDYTGTTKATYTINKAANPLAMKPKTATVKYKKLKKKARPLAVTKVITFTKQLKDKKTYTLSSAKKGKKSFKKYFKINKTTGKVTVKKGLKKGIYKVKVKVKAAGNTNYNPSALKTVTFKVRVK